MVTFPRWRRRDPKASIEAFWVWWLEVKDDYAQALLAYDEQLQAAGAAGKPIPPGERGVRAAIPSRLVRALNGKVAAIHPDLSWELIDGVLARHALVLAPEGAPELRPVTERWRRSGPGDDENWEYYPARPPNPSALYSDLRLGRRVVKPKDARFNTELDHERGRVHVTVSHPDLPYLEDAERLQFAFFMLDWVLGEDDVERWIGEVRFSDDTQPLDGPALRGSVAELAREFSAPQWAHLEGLDEYGREATVQVRVPLPRLDNPLFDLHGTVRFALATNDSNAEQAREPFAPVEPDTAELLTVESLTRVLMALVGDSAALTAIVILADELTLHLYVDHDGVVPDQVEAWAEPQDRKIDVKWSMDPGWEAVRHFV